MGIFFLVIGIICVMNPHIQMESMAFYIAIIFIIYALFQIFAGLLTKDNQKLRVLHIAAGAVVLVCAIFIFANLELIGKYLPSLIGFFMILSSGSSLFHSLILWKNGESGWWLGAVLAAIVLVLGFVFLLSPGFVGKSFGIFTGVTLLINGTSNLISFMQLKS